MSDQYAEYVSTNFENRFIVSREFDESPPGRIRIYGRGNGSKNSFVGITFHYPGRWDSFSVDKYSKHLKAIAELGVRADVPIIWIGEFIDNPTPSDDQEIGLLSQTESGYEVDSETIPLKDSIELMWDLFNVDASAPVHGKSFNDQPVDGFHEFTIDKLGLTTIDLDLIALDEDGLPIGLVEIKRTFGYSIDEWYPFVGQGGDKPNYLLQKEAAEQTSTVPYILSQPGRGYIDDSDDVYLYNLLEDDECTVRDFGRDGNPKTQDPDLSHSRRNCSAQQATEVILDSTSP